MDMFPLRFFYNPYYIANILALVDVTSHFRVNMDTNHKRAMFIYTGPYFVFKFYQCCEGFYYFDTSAPKVFNPSANSCSFLITI